MVSLAVAKLFLRVDFDTDDADIERMIAAASDHYRSIGVDVDADPVPPAIEQAVLMLVGHFYANREAMSDFQRFSLEIGVDRLIAPHREYGV
ncbi:head-tail connector protein [Brucella pituitosa]|uniref:Phage gp6-like head-tail connector protein n=1 Tax=Brucella pituitosa TaxID=571256 RepID=A0ABS3JU45_9HYPH|nr:head-tail connector protein [Brucella pituitosa]MBO1038186.1 phage gp6-like head-tail connector protein [Brucella pituitosa]